VIKVKILAVDDSKEYLVLLKRILHQEGYTETEEAVSAEEAFKILSLNDSNYHPDIDLILMDVVMPGTDGIQACREIKSKEHLKDIPLIIITSKTEEDTLKAAFDAGAMDYVTKSTSKVVLVARVKSALLLKEERDQRKARERELMETARLLEKANQKLQEQSFLDGLTGIANRRRFDEYIKKEWARAVRNGSTISLIMADIDHFKSYNDNYGHLAGDDCLKKVARLLYQTLKRPADLVARYGGEEFVVLLPETDLEGAKLLAEKIRSNVEDAGLPHAYSEAHDRVTVSLGVSSILPSPQRESSELVKNADEALYRAKEKGRNRVEAYLSPEG